MKLTKTLSFASLKLALLFLIVTGYSNAATFNFNDFSTASGLNYVSDTAVVGSALRLTSSNPSRVGAVWFSNLVNVQSGFTTLFNFQITDQFAYRGDGTIASGSEADGGDGLVFVVQNSSNTALGLANSGIGYYGIANSLAVEFDTWKNRDSYCEPNNNHIAVNSLGTATNRPEHCASTDPLDPFPNPNLGIYSPSQNMSDGGIYQAKINYTPGSLKVFFVDMSNPVMDVAVDLGSLLSLDGGTGAYIGLTSSTGGGWENHDLVNWSFSNVPEPGSLTFVALGIALLAVGRFARR